MHENADFKELLLSAPFENSDFPAWVVEHPDDQAEFLVNHVFVQSGTPSPEIFYSAIRTSLHNQTPEVWWVPRKMAQKMYEWVIKAHIDNGIPGRVEFFVDGEVYCFTH